MSRMSLKLECGRCGAVLEVKAERVIRFSGDVVVVGEELERAMVPVWRDHLTGCARAVAHGESGEPELARVEVLPPLEDDDIPW